MAPADDYPRRPGMTIQAKILAAIAVSGLAAFAMTSQAHALTAQECSAKYQAAKTAGTLGGQKWNDFRKAQCGADATPAAIAAARGCTRCGSGCRAQGSRQGSRPGRKPRRLRRRQRRQAPRSIRTPSIRKYSKETDGKARMHTCAGSIQRQQGRQRQWWHEVDPEGRRVLQRMLQEAEGRGLTSNRRGRGRMFRPRLQFAEQCFG